MGEELSSSSLFFKFSMTICNNINRREKKMKEKKRKKNLKRKNKNENMGGGDGSKSMELHDTISMSSKFFRAFPKLVKFGGCEPWIVIQQIMKL
jgi:hypothetical protein